MKWRRDYRFLSKVRIAVRRRGVVESSWQKLQQGTCGSCWPTADSIETTNRPSPGRVGDSPKPAPATAGGRRTGEGLLLTGGCPTARATSHAAGTRCGYLMILPARAKLMSENPTLPGPGAQVCPTDISESRRRASTERAEGQRGREGRECLERNATADVNLDGMAIQELRLAIA